MAEVLYGRIPIPDFKARHSPETPRSETPTGLRTLDNLQKQVSADLRRTGASIALNRSMESWIQKKSPTASIGTKKEILNTEEFLGPMPKLMPNKVANKQRRSMLAPARMCFDEHINLMEAFKAHSAAFDMDGDGTICVEELIIIFNRCNLFDTFFTPNRLRNYFSTLCDGCNHVCGLSEPLGADGIGFPEFKEVLKWAADMKGVDFNVCAKKVVNLSRKLCDAEASVQRKIEVVFDAWCKNDPTHMSAFEFGHLCRKVNLDFGMGDVFSLFSQFPGGIKGRGVDFQGFVGMLNKVGDMLNVSHEEVFARFAKAVDLLDTDEATIIKVKMRMKYAASLVGGADWKQFFRSMDADKSGCIDLDEFLDLCRHKLHLADSVTALQILFEKLDVDASGELSIDELVAFIDE